MADHELEPMTKSVLAAPHSMCELRAILLKTVITVADILLVQFPRVQAAIYVAACWLILFYSLDMVGGCRAGLGWAGLASACCPARCS